MVEDDLLDRLRTIGGTAAVFDAETLPDRYTMGAAPVLILQHISSVPETEIGGDVVLTQERWQVSVRGVKMSNVRLLARAVISSLHGFSSESIHRCDYESWPGTIRENAKEGNPAEYHAPVDFLLLT